MVLIQVSWVWGLKRDIETDLENAEHKDKDTNASMSWYVGIDFVVKLSSK